MKKCEKCNLSFDDSKRFCPNCGSPLSDTTNIGGSNMKFTLPDEMNYSAPTAVESVKPSTRKKSMAILLAFLGGTFGVHSFYLGFTRKGIFQILSCLIGVSAIWAVVDIFKMAFSKEYYDADGNILL